MWLGSAGSSPVCTIAYLPPDHRRGREYDSIMCSECCVASRIIPWGKQSPFGVPPNTCKEHLAYHLAGCFFN